MRARAPSVQIPNTIQFAKLSCRGAGASVKGSYTVLKTTFEWNEIRNDTSFFHSNEDKGKSVSFQKGVMTPYEWNSLTPKFTNLKS